MAAVEIIGVTKTFGRVTAVDDLSLTIPEGAVYGLIGPNGSGKTTAMRMVTGIIYPDAGSIRLFGERRSGTRSPDIGYLPEERGVYRRMGVRTLLEFYGELRAGRKVRREVEMGLERLGMSRYADRRIDTLSKGMSQKIQFLAAVIPEPRLLILDEPFSGLDPVSADSIRGAILEMRERGSTVILSTHEMSTAENMCDSICMIFRGKKVLDGTLSAIQANYESDTLRVEVDGGAAALDNLPGVESVRDYGRFYDLRAAKGCDPQQVLKTILTRARVDSFSVIKPSLHEIFLRIAGPPPGEVRLTAGNVA